MAESKVVINSTSFNPAGGVKSGKNPIIFLHAMLCSKEIWGDIPQTVADSTSRRCYTYDARNHGNTEGGSESNFSFNVNDLFTFMNDLEGQPKQVVIVGHDMGGMTAIRAALEQPSKFEMVFIVEMFAEKVSLELIKRTKTFMTTWTKCVQELPENTPMKDVTRLSVTELYERLEEGKKQENEKESYLTGQFVYKKTAKGYDAKYNTDALLTALDELEKKQELEKNQEEYDGEYKGPAFFIYGTKSHYKINEKKDSMVKHFPNAELIPVENGSHFFVADKPDKLTKILGEKISAV